MDMDSTLITMETIDELADMVNIKAEVAAITERAMRGEIEYDQSLRERLALLKGLDESALQRVYDERLKFSPGAERMLEKVRAAGIKTLLVSGGFTYMTDRLRSRVKLDYTHSNVLEISNGKLTGKVIGEIVNADAKLAAMRRIAAEIGASKEQIAGVGDGANDLKFMAECGVSIAYRAKPVVREKTTYAINHAGLDALLWWLSAEVH
jgi:phosphoserine phosphatase